MGTVYNIVKVGSEEFANPTFNYIQSVGTEIGYSGDAIWKMIATANVYFVVYSENGGNVGSIFRSEEITTIKGCWTLAPGNVYTWNIRTQLEGYAGYYFINNPSTIRNTNNDYYTSYDAALNAIRLYQYMYPITYRLTNCTAPSAPIEAAIGESVTVPLQFTSGYGIVNPSSDVYVTNNGVVIPSQYISGNLTFTMPDPSQ